MDSNAAAHVSTGLLMETEIFMVNEQRHEENNWKESGSTSKQKDKQKE